MSSQKEESKRDSQNQSIVSGGMSVRDTNQSFSKQLVWGNISKPHNQEFDSFLDKLKEEKQLIAE